MNDGKITVGVVNWFSGDQIKDLFESLIKNAKEPEKIEFVVCDNTSGKDVKLASALEESCLIFDYSPIIPKDWKPRRAAGSYAHGMGLNFLMEQIKTEYCLFADPDCIVFMKGWDIHLKELIDDNHVAAGAPYHCSKITKYHNFPSPIFTFFNLGTFKGIQADWIPYRLSLTTLISDQLRRIPAIIGGYLGSKIWGGAFYLSRTAEMLRFVFGNSGKDTGWKIAASAKKKGFTASLLTTAVSPDQLNPTLAEQQPIIDLMTEFELFLLDGKPFVTHLYSTKRRRKGNMGDASIRWRALASSVSDIMTNAICE